MTMRIRTSLTAIIAAATLPFMISAFAAPGDTAITRATHLEENGHFKEAAKTLKDAIAANPAPEQRKKLEFELDRLQRIKQDFPYSVDELYEEVRQSVKGLTRTEFDQWVKEGRFDSRDFDGRRYYMSSGVANLFFRHQELAGRRMPRKDTTVLDHAHLAACEEIRKAAIEQRTPYVLPRRFHVTMIVTAKADAAPAGEIINAWLPIPREYPFQKDFALVSSSSPAKDIAPATSSIRSLRMEQRAEKSKPTVFKIDYGCTKYGVRFEVDPSKVKPAPAAAELKPFLSEAPHVQFTSEMKRLAKQIAGDEQNPYLKAKKYYEWIGGQIKYSYAIEYSTIRNISEYCRTRQYGDCGQEALLFITLCRLSGIPARWQSGWDTFPHATTIHDWCEIYIAPYGWMPVDPYMSIYATRYATTLNDAQRKEVRDFFFGGQDWYRIAANSNHNQELVPQKKSMRSDNVDFQRGELEWGNHNIYFDKYSYKLTYTEQPITKPE